MEMKTNRLYIRTLRETNRVEIKNILAVFNNRKSINEAICRQQFIFCGI